MSKFQLLDSRTDRSGELRVGAGREGFLVFKLVGVCVCERESGVCVREYHVCLFFIQGPFVMLTC